MLGVNSEDTREDGAQYDVTCGLRCQSKQYLFN